MIRFDRKSWGSAAAALMLAACGGGNEGGSGTASLAGASHGVATALAAPNAVDGSTVLLPPSNRLTINLGQTAWRYLKDNDPIDVEKNSYDDSAANTKEVWKSVGVPQSPSDDDTFLNLKSGGGQGQLTGNTLWYRKHFTLDASYADRKVFVEFEGAHTGAQVYINGNLLPTNSLVNPAATHVMGFVPFIVDLTPYLKFDSTDNVMAVKVSRGDKFFSNPGFSGAFRFGQADSGLFRPVWMYIEDRVHIPQNTWSTLNTWGTYVSTVSASNASAVVRVQTNVRNEYPTDQTVTLGTQIVDATGAVVASTQDTKVVGSAPLPLVPVKTDPTIAPPSATFDQTLTVTNPTLWYPNNSTFGKPYLYKVIHTVSINGVVVDATSTPLGIRTITWDQNFPIINGHPHHLWGGSGRYDYPALGAAVPEELKWRDVALLAAAGGSLYRPGHSGEGPEFLAAADAYGVMVIQPSGDGENGFANLCPGSSGEVRPNGCNANSTDIELKREIHRDMIVHDRNNPSVLAWEADNGSTDTSFAQALKALSQTWDPVLTRVQSDRTPNPANGEIIGCSGNGCDIGVKSQFPNSPTWGSEYWGDGVQRALYDYELAFAANPVKNWAAGLRANVFGIAHWYLADTPGEITSQVDGSDRPFGVPTGTQPTFGATVGTLPFMMRGNAASMMDSNRIPRLLYYIYQAAWTPFEIKPVVKLGYHWNRTGNITVNAFSNCPAVRLLVNGQAQGADQTPNPQTIDVGNDIGPNTVSLPRQVHWNIAWAAGTLTAQCLDVDRRVVSDAAGKVVADTMVTAGPADHIQLTIEPGLVRPDGTPFQVSANGTDAAIATVTVVDAAGNRVPMANNIVTFAVSGPGTYRGGADSYVSFTPGQTPRDDGPGDPGNVLPLGYHAPGDPNLAVEGGVTRAVVRSQFTPGTVTVSVNAPGLRGDTKTFEIKAAVNPAGVGSASGGTGNLAITPQPATALAVVAPPQAQTVTIGQTARFNVLVSGAAPINFQWTRNGTNIAGANGSTYTTPATVAGDSGASYAVVVANGATRVTSSAAVLTVVAPSVPTVVAGPAASRVIAGQSAQFTVTATGSPTLSYQWLKNRTAIPGAVTSGATGSVYTTPLTTTADDGASYSVTVSNSAGSVTSAAAVLSVGAGDSVGILNQPRSLAVAEGQSATFSVLVTGSAPLHYQWKLGTVSVGTDAATLVLQSVQSSDAGSYTVTVTNATSSVVSDPAVLSVSGGNGPNLALGKTGIESSEQGGDLNAKFAFDGDPTTRWASKAATDPSWVGVDLGSPQTFNRVVLRWETAYGSSYDIQVSDDGQTWNAALSTITNGKGGLETVNFPTVTKRYVRMYGRQREAGSGNGYSLFEMGVYGVPQCGGGTERYTTRPAAPGTYNSTIPGLPSGPFVPTVQDNRTTLVWQQYVTTFPQAGAQFTQPIAANYCASISMRLPTQAEALTVAGANYSQCAFPNPWTTWTTTSVPNESTRAYFVSSAGVSSSQIIDNAPGWALCVSGTATSLPPPPPPTASPTIVTQPHGVTVAAGQPVSLSVVATGDAPIHYQWKLGGAIVGTDASTYTIASTQAANAGSYTVTVSNSSGTAVSDAAVVALAVAGGTSVNLAVGRPAFESSEEGPGLNARYAFDADANSRWASAWGIDPSWIAVDLGSVRPIETVVLKWEGAYATVYEIQTSNDNVAWAPAVFTQNAGKGGTETIALPPNTSARYVRMYGKQRIAVGYGYSLYDFQVIGPQAAGSVGNAGNLAAGKPAFESSEQDAGLNAKFAFDGDPATRWASAGGIDPSWIAVDLGSAQPVGRVVLVWEAAYGSVYDIQTSSDNLTWSAPVFTQTAGKGGTETLVFPTTTARYVRMYGRERGAKPYGYSLYDFQVYPSP